MNRCKIFTSNICLNSLGLSGYWLFGVFVFVGMFKSVRRGALFYQTLSVEAHESKIRAI
jgi:hypothetical protein